MKTQINSFGFEKLIVWQESRKLVKRVYDLTEKFPKIETYSLASQIHRSVVSVSANIAEGSSRSSRKDFCRFIEISYGSLTETLNHLYLAVDLNYIDNESFEKIKPLIIGIAEKLSALRRSLQNIK